jgi:hypothetical protein
MSPFFDWWGGAVPAPFASLAQFPPISCRRSWFSKLSPGFPGSAVRRGRIFFTKEDPKVDVFYSLLLRTHQEICPRPFWSVQENGWTVQGWPVHQADWKREIRRSVVDGDALAEAS